MNLSEKDKKNIWHPFTHQKDREDNIVIIKGEGVYLYDEQDKKYLDAISSWWVNLHGHNNPHINKKIVDQLSKIEHLLFSGFTHEPAIMLAEKLLQFLPANQSKIFYSDNGSTAVEVAIKMVLQYWNNNNKAKTIFLAFDGAYHGDTFGSMSVGARNVFNQAFDKLLFDVVHLPLPSQANIEEIKASVKLISKSNKVAGFIFEPLVQGAAGMRMYEAEYLDQIISLCNEMDILTIADEVMTGFGRTGKFLASDYLVNKPDILCLSKGLTAGYMPLGVTSCADKIFQAYVQDDKTKTFFHGHSYTANPLACAAAIAGMELMENEATWEKINLIHRMHTEFKNRISPHKKLIDVRVMGTILALELNTQEKSHYLNAAADKISDYFIERGVILRPLGNVFYVLPPYVINREELEFIYKNIIDFLNNE
ncbi:MAG: adenosylmethionine--8-amino-7-oxononanoate transaminase [Sphingobacteriaceae bacterium]|nr:adenosylmethionine--8-amino-7-oxononanoate transaminase [Sphingobacteriaceae bacterium]